MHPQVKDISGQTFNRLTPFEYISHGKWKCRCFCGGETVAWAPDLKRGKRKSCGCLNQEHLRKNPNGLIDITGKKFGRLLVIQRIGNGMWECKCDCGVVRPVRGRFIRDGHTTSCGCYHMERLRTDRYKHGSFVNPEYSVWSGMIQRCYNPKTKRFEYYGGRGISVCQRWLNSFSDFLADMGPRPSSDHTIERIDVNGNYEPGNCKWLESRLQHRNKTNTVYVEFEGQRKPLVQWCEEFNMPRHIVNGRIRLGWDFMRALTEPFRTNQKRPSLAQ